MFLSWFANCSRILVQGDAKELSSVVGRIQTRIVNIDKTHHVPLHHSIVWNRVSRALSPVLTWRLFPYGWLTSKPKGLSCQIQDDLKIHGFFFMDVCCPMAQGTLTSGFWHQCAARHHNQNPSRHSHFVILGPTSQLSPLFSSFLSLLLCFVRLWTHSVG